MKVDQSVTSRFLSFPLIFISNGLPLSPTLLHSFMSFQMQLPNVNRIALNCFINCYMKFFKVVLFLKHLLCMSTLDFFFSPAWVRHLCSGDVFNETRWRKTYENLAFLISLLSLQSSRQTFICLRVYNCSQIITCYCWYFLLMQSCAFFSFGLALNVYSVVSYLIFLIKLSFHFLNVIFLCLRSIKTTWFA